MKIEEALQKVIAAVADGYDDCWPGGSEWRQRWDPYPEGVWVIESAPALVIGPDESEGYSVGVFDPIEVIGLFRDDNQRSIRWNMKEAQFYVAGLLGGVAGDVLVEVFVHSKPFPDAEPSMRVYPDGSTENLRDAE